MMKFRKVFLLALVLFVSKTAVAGTETRNGGQVIKCGTSEEIFSLDFLQAKEELHAHLQNSLDLDFLLNRILQVLENKSPSAAISFRNFIKDYKTNVDESGEPIWFDAHDLDGLKESTYHPIPFKCRATSGSVVIIYQAVIRVNSWNDDMTLAKARFLVNFELFKKMNALQKSFLLVHEWLWNYTTDYQKNWRLNYLLHTVEVASMSKKDFTNKMNDIGVSFEKP